MTASLPGLDVPRLTQWLTDHAPVVRPPVTARVISAGRSNLTYEVTDANATRYVLRRPPAGDLAAGAHDVEREWRILQALAPTPIATPPLVALCADHDVMGAPFFLMRYVAGRPLSLAAAQGMTPHARRRAAEHLTQALATLHSVDIDDAGLASFRRPRNYVERQISGWLRQLDRLGTAIPPDFHIEMTTLGNQLVDARPEPQREVLVHGDFKADNLMIDESGALTAVLDWELSAIGDPLADLGWLLIWWGDDVYEGPWLSTPVNQGRQFRSGTELARTYARHSGLDVTALDYYLAFAYWRLCAINTTTRARFLSGAMTGKSLDVPKINFQLAWQLTAAREHLETALHRVV
jgi:aminoglycoside phosphotransferase (APT) family kinase protein